MSLHNELKALISKYLIEDQVDYYITLAANPSRIDDRLLTLHYNYGTIDGKFSIFKFTYNVTSGLKYIKSRTKRNLRFIDDFKANKLEEDQSLDMNGIFQWRNGTLYLRQLKRYTGLPKTLISVVLKLAEYLNDPYWLKQDDMANVITNDYYTNLIGNMTGNLVKVDSPDEKVRYKFISLELGNVW